MTGCTDAKATRDRTTWNYPGLDVCTSWLVDWLFGRLRLQIPIISWKQLVLIIRFILYGPSLVGKEWFAFNPPLSSLVTRTVHNVTVVKKDAPKIKIFHIVTTGGKYAPVVTARSIRKSSFSNYWNKLSSNSNNKNDPGSCYRSILCSKWRN